MFILDSDHISIIQLHTAPHFALVLQRMAQHSQTDFFVTIVSFHEQILGWNSYIARATDSSGIVRGYTKLEGILADFSASQVLPFDAAAVDVFDDLRQQRVRIGTMDLRIASIALANGMTVLTRNLVDFQRVPNLQVEDWTQ
ncbi:MAG: type II toxin-antitoxin system VapC family toxin [Pirellulaceae bacterium]